MYGLLISYQSHLDQESSNSKDRWLFGFVGTYGALKKTNLMRFSLQMFCLHLQDLKVDHVSSAVFASIAFEPLQPSWNEVCEQDCWPQLTGEHSR